MAKVVGGRVVARAPPTIEVRVGGFRGIHRRRIRGEGEGEGGGNGKVVVTSPRPRVEDDDDTASRGGGRSGEHSHEEARGEICALTFDGVVGRIVWKKSAL
jgi:hypothetical protein